MDQDAPFILSNGTKIMYPEGNEKMQKNAEFLASYIKDLTGKSLAVQAGTDGKGIIPVSYTHLRAHETGRNLVCRLLLEKKNKKKKTTNK